jgi:hypothetical protein
MATSSGYSCKTLSLHLRQGHIIHFFRDEIKILETIIESLLFGLDLDCTYTGCGNESDDYEYTIRK